MTEKKKKITIKARHSKSGFWNFFVIVFIVLVIANTLLLWYNINILNIMRGEK